VTDSINSLLRVSHWSSMHRLLTQLIFPVGRDRSDQLVAIKYTESFLPVRGHRARVTHSVLSAPVSSQPAQRICFTALGKELKN